MALEVSKSMEIKDFWKCWQHIAALVEEEYHAVEKRDGYYELSLILLWDCEEEDNG